MALKDQADIARDERFMRRVQVAMCSVAINIHGEPADGIHHAARAEYARAVLNDPERYMPIFSLAICAYDGALTTASPDSVVRDAVASVWNALAGTPPDERGLNGAHFEVTIEPALRRSLEPGPV